MSAHRLRRVAGATVLALLAPLVVVTLSAPAEALTQTVPVALDGTTTQVDRITRNGVASTCGSAKPFPGMAGTATTYNVTTYEYVAPSTGCLTIARSAVTCASQRNLHLAVYQKAYDPTAQQALYLGDKGSSNDTSTIGIDVVKGRTYVLVAMNALNQEACSANVTFTPADDTTPPETLITRAPGAKVRDSSAVLTFKGDPVGDASGFQCRLDSAAFTACESPLVLEGLAVGSHTVEVRAMDLFGNVDPTPAVAAFTSCDLAGATRQLGTAETAAAKAAKAVTKARKAVAKASSPRAEAKARKQLARATKKAKAATKKVATLRQGIRACAQ